ncbi:MAG: (2Fe-2S)-binding protein [Chloroflexi bacterium]|nr:(2Fe-2S)-binding protein [Chloroflexota bacterium]
MYVCLCRGVTEAKARELGEAGYISASSLAAALRLNDDDCCGRCLREIEPLLAIACGACPRRPAALVRAAAN